MVCKMARHLVTDHVIFSLASLMIVSVSCNEMCNMLEIEDSYILSTLLLEKMVATAGLMLYLV